MCRVDRGVSSANVVGEELNAAVVGSDVVVQVGDGEVLGAVDPDGGEEGVVGLVEAGEEVLNEFFLIKGRPATASSSAKLFILVKYYAVVRFSFLVLARATRRFETHVLDWEAKMVLIAPILQPSFPRQW
jgi:hypothetical protein